MSPNDACPHADGAAQHALLHLTWTVTYSYTDYLPLRLIAAAAQEPLEVLAVDPSRLRGAASIRVAGLLAERQDTATALSTDTEFDILRAELGEQPSIADLARDAWAALQAESDADRPSDTGRALAALLAGLRREGITDR